MRAVFRKVLPLGFVVGLAACGSALPPVEGASPHISGVGVPAPALAPAPPPPQPPAATAALSVTAVSLKGLDSKGIVTVLGEPGLLRRDPPAEVWQYRGSGCVVDLFLYEDRGIHRVAHVQVRPLSNDGGRPDEAVCLSRLARPRGITPEGDNRPAL